MLSQQSCTKSSCFFCIMEEHDSSSNRSVVIKDYLKGIPFLDDEQLILVVSELWNVAMTRPDEGEFPTLGIFECMTSLINKGIHDRAWLLKNQNIYIPYYAAHIVGSYTMSKAGFAMRAVESGVISPLLELLRGKMTWVEQRVAVRALGHLASYEKTFMALEGYQDEVVELAIHLASSCVEEVYSKFVGVKDKRKRLKYHCDLLTRGIQGAEMEDRKAEEWASQMQFWSIHLLNCFAVKERCLDLMCKEQFLNDLCGMWGGLANHASPAGIGLIRILCHSKVGRESISRSRKVVENLCNLSRSSDDWQYMGIDCLVLLLRDPDTRYKVIEVATSYLVDLVELRVLGNRTNAGKAITRALLHNHKYDQSRAKIKNADVGRLLEEIRVLKIERRKREMYMSSEKLEGKRVMVKLIKQQGNHKFSAGKIEEAALKYSEGLQICPLRYRNERIVLYSNRGQCYLQLRDPDGAISDTTRALSLSTPPNSHANSLWTRAQAYDVKGMAKESLMDCIMFINACIKSNGSDRFKVPYYAVRMISKQMEATWLFTGAQMKSKEDEKRNSEKIRTQMQSKSHASSKFSINPTYVTNDYQMCVYLYIPDQYLRINLSVVSCAGLSTILEEPFAGSGRKKQQKSLR